MKRTLELALTGVAVACLLGALLSPYRHGGALRVLDAELANSDFGAFYCAAAVARDLGDPYALEPLKTCETARVYGPGGKSFASQGIDPAPLPPTTSRCSYRSRTCRTGWRPSFGQGYSWLRRSEGRCCLRG